MKRTSLKILVIFILFAIAHSPAYSYTDVTKKDWSSQAISELTSKYGIVQGYPDNKFKPKQAISREEEAAALYKLVKWVEAHPTSVAVQDLQQMKMLMSEYQSELWQIQNQLRALCQQQEQMKAHIDQIDARLDWNLKNRGLAHMVLMGGGKTVVGAGKDVVSIGKGAVWLFTLGKVNLFENPEIPPDPVDKTNRYNGPVQFVNGSAF